MARFLDMDTDVLREEEDEPWLRKHLKLTRAISALVRLIYILVWYRINWNFQLSTYNQS